MIQERFPPESPINYDPIERVRIALAKKYNLSDEVSRVDIAISKTLTNSAAPLPRSLSEPSNESENAHEISGVPKTRIPTDIITAPATLSSRSATDYESDQSNTISKKMKSMGGTLDSETPTTQPCERRKDGGSGTAEDLGFQITSGGGTASVNPMPAM